MIYAANAMGKYKFCVLVKDIMNPDQAFRFKCQ